MTVQELINTLTEMVAKRKRIADMDVEFFVPLVDEPIPNDINAWNHHDTFHLEKKNIYVNEWFNGETWDDSDDSYEYVEIKVG